MKLLVVEDNKDDLVLLSALLNHRGHEVFGATGGKMGLLTLEVNEVDAVLVDIRMPGMDGPEFLTLLRADPRWTELPIVGRTALPAEDVPEMVFSLSHFVLLQKPHSTEELESALTKVCQTV